MIKVDTKLVKRSYFQFEINFISNKFVKELLGKTKFGNTSLNYPKDTNRPDVASRARNVKSLVIDVRCIRIIPLLNAWSSLRGCLR